MRLQPAGDVGVDAAFGGVMAAPILLVTLAYATLAWRVRDPERRWRVAVVASAFLVVFGAILAGFLFEWEQKTWYPLAYQVPLLAAGALVLAAYRPPRWIRARWTAA